MSKITDFYPLIGKVVVAFQEVDFLINLMFASLLREQPDISMAVATSLSFSKKLNVLKAISQFKIRASDLQARLDEVIKKLGRAEDERNRIVHAAWIPSSVDDKVFFHKPRITQKHGVKNGGIRESFPSEIEETLQSIGDAKQELLEFLGELERKSIIRTRMFGGEKKK